MSKLQKVRVDKWLWAVRIFKSRTLSNKKCKSGKVRIDGEPVKPAQMIERGEIIEVKKNGINMRLKVVDLLKKRVGAKLAEPCYEDLTPEAERNKFNKWRAMNTQTEFREKGAGRPTKRERRQLDKFKGK